MGSLSGKRVAVTGADGFIGSCLTEKLVRDGATVRALVQYNPFGASGWLDRTDPAIRAGMEIQAGDIRDSFFMRRFCEGQDVVMHLAALIGIPFSYVAPQSYVDTNVTGSLNVFEACRNAGVGRVVHTSTSEVYGTARFEPITEAHPLQGQSPYSASKIAADHMAEAYARSFDLPVVILRPFNTFGPRQSERAVIPTAIRQALDPACTEIRLGDLSPMRDFNYVEDTADAFIAIGGAAHVEFGTAYNTGTGRAVSIGETVEIIRRATGVNKPIREDASRIRPANSEVYKLISSAGRLAEATGWSPALGLEEGLARTAAWWRDEIREGRTRPDSGYLV